MTALTRGALLWSSALGLLLIATRAAAQQAVQLPTLSVEGTGANDYKADKPALSILTQTLLDTPQAINVVTSQLMKDRGVTSLPDALRNVPGISLAGGEFSWQGTNLTIRGFSARNDIYLDGQRDFGSYYRDPFNLDQVQVLQGPASMLFGRGSTGGVVNQVSKAPMLEDAYGATLSFGSGKTKRATFGLAGMWGEGTALRVTGMANDSMIPRQDVGRFRRYGIAPSLSIGLNTDTRFTISYFHQVESNVPSYGIPWLRNDPAPVARGNFYGFKTDFLDIDSDMVTAKLEHDYNDNITVREQLRYASYYRDFRISEPVVQAGTSATAPLASINITRNMWSGYSRETMLQSVTDATAKFETGSFGHTMVAGFQVGPETSAPLFSNSTGVQTNNLLSPNEDQPFIGTNFRRLKADTKGFSIAAYVFDTIKINEQWELSGGVRWDRFDSDYRAVTYSQPPAALNNIVASNNVMQVDDMPSYRAGLVYKPVPEGTLYFNYGTSFNPSAEGLSQITTGRALGIGFRGLPPEENQNLELGVKWDLMQGALSTRASLFQLTKLNARIPNPALSGFSMLGGEQEVKGFDTQLTGYLTPDLQINVGYAYLDSAVTKSGPGGPAVGMPLPNVPKHSATLFALYKLPFGGKVGGGMSYLSKRLGQNTAPVETAPGYVTFDLMGKYEFTENFAAQVNVYNLTDKYYFDQIHGFHLLSGAARSVLFTLSAKH